MEREETFTRRLACLHAHSTHKLHSVYLENPSAVAFKRVESLPSSVSLSAACIAFKCHIMSCSATNRRAASTGSDTASSRALFQPRCPEKPSTLSQKRVSQTESTDQLPRRTSRVMSRVSSRVHVGLLWCGPRKCRSWLSAPAFT